MPRRIHARQDRRSAEDASIRTTSEFRTSNHCVYAIVARGKTVHELIRRARRRFLNQELLSQGANTFSAGLAAFIVLLLLGTEVLNWYFAALIPLAAIAVGIYRAYRRRPSAYRTAQIVDHRL